MSPWYNEPICSSWGRGILHDSFDLGNWTSSAYLAPKCSSPSPLQLHSSAELQSNLNNVPRSKELHPTKTWEQEETISSRRTSIVAGFFFYLSGHENQLAYWKFHLEDAKLWLKYSISKSSPTESIISTRPIYNPLNCQHFEKCGIASQFLVD